MNDHRSARNAAGTQREVRIVRTDEVRTVSYREAVGLVSRGLAVFHVAEEPAEPKKAPAKKAPAKKSAAKKAAPPVYAEQVFADPTSPITPTDLPGPASGDAADTAENKPLDIL